MAHNLTRPPGEVKSEVTGVNGLFSSHVAVPVGDLEVVHATLSPGLSESSPQVRDALRRWPGRWFVRPSALGPELTLVRRAAPRPRERWWVHALLLAATFLTTTYAGARLAGFAPRPPVPGGLLPGPALSLADLAPGLWFSLPLMAVLLAHEAGHYALGRRHQMSVSPPWFLPAPDVLSLIGTFGAFIRIRSPFVNRPALLDVGAAGPLAGFVVAVPAAVLGLRWSALVPAPPAQSPVRFGLLYDGYLVPLGGSLGFDALVALAAPHSAHGVLILHPLAIAGWVGLLFTALNLLPVWQLDGAHVLFALVGKGQTWAGAAAVAAAAAGGFLWPGWWVWAAVVVLLGRGSVKHPPVYDSMLPLDRRRRAVGWACIAVLLLTLPPRPF